jgi:hypothetical protein
MRAPPSVAPAADFAANRFTPAQRLAFLDELAQSGATWQQTDEDMLLVSLPEAADRTSVFALYNREVDELGESFGGEADADADGHVVDRGQHQLAFGWD